LKLLQDGFQNRTKKAIDRGMQAWIFTVLMSFISSLALAQNQSIKNFQVVSQLENGEPFIFRGSQPFKDSHYEQLKKMKIQNVIIFKIEKDQEVLNEKIKLVQFGIEPQNIYHIPMKWKDFSDYTEACEWTKKALMILVRSYQNRERTYFHCTAGQDRTGYLDGLFQLWLNPQVPLNDVFQKRLCQFGYAGAEPKKPKAISNAIDQELTIYFEKIARQIQGLNENGQLIEQLNCQQDIGFINSIQSMSCLDLKSVIQ